MRIVIIQPLLPKYDISFFNRLSLAYPAVEWLVLADIQTSNPLNQYVPGECNFEVQHVPSLDWHGLILRPGLVKELERLKPDLIVFNANPRDISQLWCMFRRKVRGETSVSWGMFHRIGGLRLYTRIYYLLVGKVATKCLTYSRIGALTLRNIGVANEKIGIVGTAIDESIPLRQKEIISPQELEQFQVEQGLGGKHVVLQVVRLSRIKRADLLIDAALLLLKLRSDILFVLIGDGEMRATLQEKVVERNLSASVRFLGAIYEEPILAKWYLSASVFVVPTCIGLSAHHAMCYGVPVITDDSIDKQASEFEILYHGLNAWTYREGDAQALATAIASLADQPGLRQLLSSNAVHTVQQVHTLNNKVQNFARHIMRTSATSTG